MTNYRRSLVFAGPATALALVLATPALAQTPEAPAQPEDATTVQPGAGSAAGAPSEEFTEEGEEIVVTGVRRGSVIGDIPPENVLTARDVRATGATDITELLEALAPQIGSARGRGGERPITLLNGQRVSSFREMRDIPTEAIERVDILPEEVALKYGYSADQRVVNIVLRPRFQSTVVEVEGGGATEGNYGRGELDVDRLLISKNGRTMFSIDADANDWLTEYDRDIDLEEDATGPDERPFRTLVGSRAYARGSATANRQLGTVSATLNGEVEHLEGRSMFGLSDAALDPLIRKSTSDTAHLGLALNGNVGKWRWSSTGNADLERSVTLSDRADETERDRSRTFTTSGDVDVTANGPLFKLPAGDASMTVRVGASSFNRDIKQRNEGDIFENDLSRTRGSGSLNVDLPVSRRNRDFSALGNLTLNANAEVEQLSDFGTLTTVGAGFNWSPVDRLSFLGSWTREEGAPSVSQLGDPILETPETRVFDFTTGETVLVTAITGGNPDLLADKRSVIKFGGNWKPWEKTDLRLRAEYVRTHIDRPVSSFPGVSEELEEAFPERFIRDEFGQLVAVDFRPVNYDQSRRETIRWGFDFTKPLTSARPSQAAMEQFRARRAAERGQTTATGQTAPTAGGPPPEGAPPPDGAGPPPGGPGGGGFGPGGPGGGFGGGRFGGGRQGGRLQFSLTHTLNLVDEVTIRPGLPELDYLDGDAVGSSGGRPRHQLEAQGGYFNNGLGARLSANWRSATRVDSTDGNNLRFSPVATFDLRLFANLGERFDLVAKHPWLRGTSVRFEVANVFNTKPRVRDAAGEVPFSYQPDLLDPLGRTVSISIRKLFLPPRSFFQRQRGQSQS